MLRRIELLRLLLLFECVRQHPEELVLLLHLLFVFEQQPIELRLYLLYLLLDLPILLLNVLAQLLRLLELPLEISLGDLQLKDALLQMFNLV